MTSNHVPLILAIRMTFRTILQMTFKTWDFPGVFKEDFEWDFEGYFKGYSRWCLREPWRETWRGTWRGT